MSILLSKDPFTKNRKRLVYLVDHLTDIMILLEINQDHHNAEDNIKDVDHHQDIWDQEDEDQEDHHHEDHHPIILEIYLEIQIHLGSAQLDKEKLMIRLNYLRSRRIKYLRLIYSYCLFVRSSSRLLRMIPRVSVMKIWKIWVCDFSLGSAS